MQKEKKSQKSHEMKFCLRGRRQEFFHLDQQLQKTNTGFHFDDTQFHAFIRLKIFFHQVFKRPPSNSQV